MNAPNQLNFLPDDYLVRKAQHRTNVICATLFVVMIGGIAIAFTTAERKMRDAEERHSDVQRQYADAAKRISELQTLQQKQSLLARQAELSASLIDRVPRSYMLAEITNRLPQGVSLTDMEMTARKRTQAAAAGAKTTFAKKKAKSKNNPEQLLPPPPEKFDTLVRLSGIAETDAQVAKLISALNESNVFIDVNLLISAHIERSDTELRRFNLEMMLNPEADIRPSANKPTELTQVSQ